MKRDSAFVLVVMMLTFAALASSIAMCATPVLVDAVFFGGSGDQAAGWGGAPIAVGDNGLYTCGYGTWSGIGYPSIGLHYGLPISQQPLWSQYWPSSAPTPIGYEVFQGVTETDEGVYFAGYSYQTSDGVGDKEDKSVLVKMGMNGSYEWAAKPNFYPYRGGESFSAVTNAVEDNINVVYTGGHAQANGANFTALIAKYDTAGNMIWWKPIGDTSYFHVNSVNGIAILGNDVYAAGVDYWASSFSYAKLWKCTPAGVSTNIATYSVASALTYGQSIVAQDNSLYVAGYITPGPNDGYDALILKYDESGNLIWHTEWGGAGEEQAWGIAADAQGVYVVGHTTSFGSGGEDAFLITLDPATGAVTSSTYYGDTLNDRARGCVLVGNELYVSGASTSFASNSGNLVGQSDMMLLRYRLGKTDQTINFDAIDEKTFGDADFIVSATATSGLAVTFTASGDCTVTLDGTVHITGAGSGTITAHQAGDSNFNAASEVSQTFTINKANLTITAENRTKLYLAENPSFTATYNGFVNGETESSLSGILSFSTTATEASWVGSYPITSSGLTSNNYNITYVDGVLMITFKGNSGILQPVNQDNSSVFKQGSTIPLKFKVYDNNNTSVGAPPDVVSSFNLNMWSSGTVSEVNEPTVSTTPDTAFRWSATDQQWIFNLSTKSLVKGQTYQGTIKLVDGSEIIFRFGLR